MRISPAQHESISRITAELAGCDAKVTLFGSRVDDNKRGGDLDLLIEIPHDVENPAWLSAQLAARISRMMNGRHVDIVLAAPNLMTLPIHEQAKATGIPLT